MKFAIPNQPVNQHVKTNFYAEDKDVTGEKLQGHTWKEIGHDFGNTLVWSGDGALKNRGVANYSGKDWSTTNLPNTRNWDYNFVKGQNYNYHWDPKDENDLIEVAATPLEAKKVEGNKFVDNFKFPNWQKKQRQPLQAADFSIDKSVYNTNGIKKMFVDGDGVWSTDNENAQVPQLFMGSVGGWSGVLRGDLNNASVEKNNLQYLGQKDVSDNWRELSLEEMSKLGFPKMNAGHLESARIASEGAFGELNFDQLGYRRESQPESSVVVNTVQD